MSGSVTGKDSGRRPTLLVVDDSTDNTFIYRQILTTALPGCRVVTAESGPVALETLAGETPDGIIADVQMPGMSGIEFCRQVKESPRSGKVPLILITAHGTTSQLKAEGLEAGADDFLSRPIDNTEFVARVKVMLRIKRGEDALRRINADLGQEVRRRAESLLEVEHRCELMIENSSDAIFVHRPNPDGTPGRFIETNLRASELVGYSKEEFLRLTPDDVTEGSGGAAARVRQVLDEESLLFETTMLHREGTLVPVEINSHRFDLDGKVTILSVVRDITERRRSEAARQSEAAIDQALIGVMTAIMATDHSKHSISQIVLDAALSITESSHGFIASIEPGTGNLITENFTEMMANCNVQGSDRRSVFPAQPDGTYPGLWGRALNTREAFWTNAPSQEHDDVGTPDGHVRLESLLVVPAMAGDELLGEIAVANSEFGYSEDGLVAVSRLGLVYALALLRLRAVSALSESEERFRALFENAPLSYQSLDEQGNFIEVNETWCASLGYSRNEVIGMNFREFLHPDFREHFRRNFPKFKRRGFVRGVEFTLRRKDGTEVVMSFDGKIAHHDDGTFKATHCVLSDITDLKQAEAETQLLEAQLIQAQKLEAVGRLAGGIAHDFNNLLTGISGNVSLALEDADPTSESAESLREIDAAAERAGALTRQLLAFSRKQPLEPTTVDANVLLLGIMSILKTLVGEGIRFEHRLAAGPWLVVVDRGQIEQVVINLVVNARDATPDGGEITVRTKNETREDGGNIPEGTLPPGDYLVLSVTDSGSGMSTETVSQIFEPFFSTKDESKGTGLGLATSWGIVAQHGGTIEVESRLGAGSVFRVVLPRAEIDADQSVVGDVAPPPMRGGDESILLVEDEPMVRDLTIRLLERVGYHVVHMPDAKAALSYAEEMVDGVDLLLTDVLLPGMTGVDLATKIRELKPNLKVIFISGFADDVFESRSIRREDIHFVQKPFSPTDLTGTIRAVLDEGISIPD